MLQEILTWIVLVCLGILAVFVAIFLLVLPFAQLDSRSFVKQFEQTIETVEVVRAKGEMPEADILISVNQQLADYKYFNGIPFIELAISDRVDALQPIE